MNLSRSLATFCATVAIAGWATGVSAVPFPGPDAFGYQGSVIDPNWRQIGGTVVLQGTDDSATGPVIPIGFNFSFYGSAFNSINIATNGFASFNNGSGLCCDGTPMGVGQGVPNQIAALHMDWMTTRPGAQIRYQTLGAPGKREFIVEWDMVNEFNNDNRSTFEMILHELTNDIELQYLSAATYNHAGTVGIQNDPRDTGLTYFEAAANQTLVNTGLCISSGGTSCQVPEPASLALLGLGLAGLGFARRTVKK